MEEDFSKIPEKFLERTLALIDAVNNGVSVDTSLPYVPTGAELKRDNRHLCLKFSATFSNEIANAHGSYLPAFDMKFGEMEWMVESARGYFGGNLTYSHESAQELGISINKAEDKRIDDNVELYYRYVYPIESDWNMTICSLPFRHGSSVTCRSLISLEIDGKQVDVFYYKHKEQRYMFIDSTTKRTAKDMNKVSLAVRTALGMIMGNVYGDYQFVIASDCECFNSENTFGGFISLKETVVCPYRIFNTSRTILKENLMRYEYQKYALEEIQKEDGDVIWFYNDDMMPPSVPSILTDALYKDNNLLTATNLVLDTSAITVAYQVLTYCVALEAISTSLVEQVSKPIIKKEVFTENVLPVLLNALEGIKDLDEDAKRIFTLRLTNNLNAPANQDKLTLLFKKYGYTLNDADMAAIKLRNTNMHGNIIDKGKRQDDFDEFELELLARALRLHKLCCIIILKMAGFEGLILNNEVIFGMKAACERKEPALIRI